MVSKVASLVKTFMCHSECQLGRLLTISAHSLFIPQLAPFVPLMERTLNHGLNEVKDARFVVGLSLRVLGGSSDNYPYNSLTTLKCFMGLNQVSAPVPSLLVHFVTQKKAEPKGYRTLASGVGLMVDWGCDFAGADARIKPQSMYETPITVTQWNLPQGEFVFKSDFAWGIGPGWTGVRWLSK